MKYHYLIIFVSFLLIHVTCLAQDDKSKLSNVRLFKNETDTTFISSPATKAKSDSIVFKKHNPRKATLRSAILPGWGQIYNKEPWWRVTLVYGAIAIPTGFYIYNNTWYQKTRKAYDIVANKDTARFGEIDAKLQNLNERSLQFYRNEFRRNKDFSLLWILLTWGLNVVDATVYGHLKAFDVSDNLSVQVKPTYNPGNQSTGVSLVFSAKKPSPHLVAIPR